MSIVQISKIQHRSGNLVDLPQLDEAEFGWASDQKLLFIGKTTPNENVEVLTSYSHISFNQLDGSVGNLNISSASVANGQILAFDGTNWVNKGGSAGGLITLGDVANVKITGGAIGYVLETDGTGNLSWSPKGTISAFIQNVKKGNGTVGNLTLVTSVDNNIFTDGLKVTITDARGMTQLNGNVYYVDVQTSNTFALYTDAALTSPLNSSTFSDYAYTSVANTFANNAIEVGNSDPFTVNNPIKFLGSISSNGTANTNLNNTTTYYVKTKPSSTTITVSAELLSNGVAGNTVVLNAVNGLTANVYETGGRALCSLISSGGGSSNASGSITSVQYNAGGLLGGSADFTFDNATKLLNVNGNANVGNLNVSSVASASRFVSNVSTGTAPITVNSSTLVPNLYASRANVSDFGRVTSQSTGIYYPTFANGNSTANYALASNGIFSANLANGSFSATTFVGNLTGSATTAGTVTTAAQPNITSTGALTSPSLTANSANGRVSLATDSGGSISLGLTTGTSSSPYIDFNTSVSSVDFDVRLQASGNTGTVGGGTLAITAANTNISGAMNLGGGIGAGGPITGSGSLTINSSNYPQIALNSTSTTNRRTEFIYSSSGLTQFSTGVDLGLTNSRNYYIFDGIASATRLFIDQNGNVGLGGNLSPSHTLSVNGTVFATNLLNNGNQVLHAGNYNSYAPTLTGGGASGTWSISITGTAGYANNAGGITTTLPTLGYSLSGGDISNSGQGGPQIYGQGNGAAMMSFHRPGIYAVNFGLGTDNQLRTGGWSRGGSFVILDSGNYNSYAPTLNGSGATGTWSISITGTAGTVTTAAQPNITSVGTLTSLAVSGSASLGSASVTGNTSTGNLSVTSNATVSGTLSASNANFTGSNVSLGAIGNVKITGGANGQLMRTDGAGNLTFVDPGTITTPPAGFNTQVQFNNGGVLGASSEFTFTTSGSNLNVSGNIISGAALSSSTLSTAGNATIGGNLNVTVSSTINGALTVSGQTTLGSNVAVTGNITASRLTSNIATGTAPFTVTSTTRVANLNVEYAGYADSAGSASSATTATSAGYATSSGLASTVNINYNNDTNSTFQMLWGSGQGVYGTGGIYCNPALDIIYASDFYVTSDDNLKNRIGNLSEPLKAINSLNGFKFTWNAKAKELRNYSSDKVQVGISAQEVEAILPEAVNTDANGFKTVSYDSLVPLLIEAVKELSARLSALENK